MFSFFPPISSVGACAGMIVYACVGAIDGEHACISSSVCFVLLCFEHVLVWLYMLVTVAYI